MLISILIFVLVLSVLVLVHEFGHFIAAKKAGIPVIEFALGLPVLPKIFGLQIGETMYSIYPVLFGGFVRLLGENGEEKIEDFYPGRLSKGVDYYNESQFINKPKKVRVMIVTAGVIMNFLLGIVAFGIVYSISGIPRDTGQIKVLNITPGSPAQVAGLVVGDVITKVGKDSVSSVNDFIAKVDAQKGKSVAFGVVRIASGSNQNLVVSATPRANPPQGEGPLGVTITTMEIYFPPIWQRPFYGVYYGFKEAIFWGQTIIVGLWSLIAELFKGHVPQDVSGPVGIFAVTTEAARNGLMTLINFIGILSVNLAILNIVPFPALDGGRLLFIAIESIIGKKVVPKVEATIHTIGMAILLLLLLAITIHDIQRLVTSGGIAGFINSLGK